jgi:hypothetical protein
MKGTELFQFLSDQFYEAVNISDYIASNGGMTGEHWNGKNFEGSRHKLIEILSQHLSIWTEENHDNHNSA